MPSPEAPSRGSHRRSIPAALLMAGLAAVGPQAVGAAPFWDEYQHVRRVAVHAPDSVLAAAESRLGRDPDDFLAAWTAGRCAPHAADSAAIARVAGAGTPAGAGPWVTRAVLALERGRRPEAREAYERAARAYRALARPADASRALLFAAIQATPPADSLAHVATFASAESLARASGEPAAIADVLIGRAGVLYDELPGSARELREEVVRLLTPLGPSMQLATAHRGLGNVFKFAGDLDGAEREYRAAVGAANALGDDLLLSQALGGLGNVQVARAEFDSALACYTRALALARGPGVSRTLVARHGDLATLHRQLGHLRESREHLDAADRYAAEGRVPLEDRLLLLDGRAATEALAGRFDAARTALDTAVALATRAGASARVPMLRLRQAEIASDLGEDEAAERYADLGLAVARASGHRRAELALSLLRAERLLATGRTREALVVARDLSAACERSDPRQIGWPARLEAAALADLGRLDEALVRVKREIARAEATGDSSSVARTLSYSAELRMRRGDAREAERLAARSVALNRILGDSAGAYTAAGVAGTAAFAAGRHGEAIRWLRSSLAHEDRVSSQLRSSDDRAGHRSGWYDIAVTLAGAYVAEGAPERALAVLEQTRARELSRLLARRSSGLRTHVEAGLADDVERTETELEALQSLRMRTSGAARRPGAELARLDARIDSVKARHAGLIQRVQRAAPLYGAAATAVPPARPEQMRRALQAGEQVLFFMLGPMHTVVWRMDRDSLRARVLPLGEAWWAERVAGLVARLRTGSDRRRAVAGLGDTLVGGWPAGVAPARLHLLPDGPLHDLPFDALEVSVRGGGRRTLVELAEVNAAPSAAFLFSDPAPAAFPAGSTEVAAFGDPGAGVPNRAPPDTLRGSAYPGAAPLQHSRREVEAIRSVFPRTRVFVGAEATEARFFEQARRASILHVAAHGFVDDHRPAYSGLALAPDRAGGRATNDGLVQAFEVAEASIGADLATLSACESGAGTLRRGEGLQGLARAFQIAGARHLLVSLWQVEDVETADLMAAFYRRLAEGATPAAALRSAKLEALARHAPSGGNVRGVATRPRAAGRAASSTWAAFVLLGPRSDR